MWNDASKALPQNDGRAWGARRFVVLAGGEHYVATFDPDGRVMWTDDHPELRLNHLDDWRYTGEIEDVELWMEIPDVEA
ncbi:hypothetical protein [Shinella sp. G-2]|uniref:hypothetical protein n=1 Tax=Shinella sp. G-2 TaxID=3133141 RepID=UPI003CFE5A8B